MRAQYVDSVSRSDIARVLVALLVLQLFPNRQYHDADAGVSLNSHEMTPKFRPSGGFCKSLLFLAFAKSLFLVVSVSRSLYHQDHNKSDDSLRPILQLLQEREDEPEKPCLYSQSQRNR